MARTVAAIDVGTYAVRLLQGRDKKGVFTLSSFHEEARGELSAEEGLDEALDAAALKSSRARIGVSGSQTMFRYLQIPDAGDAQVRKFVEFEIAELAAQSGGDIVGGFNLLHPPSLSDELTVGMALIRASLLEEMASQLKGSPLRAQAFTPNAVGLFNAWLKCKPEGDETVLLACIGEENTDIAIAHGTDLYFARNLSGGARFFLEALRENFRVGRAKALDLLRTVADLDPAHRGKLPSPTHEKVNHALLGAAGQLSSLLRSAIVFARTQAKISDLQVERVLICGGGARLKGLCAYLGGSMGMPVELFDPFDEIDLSELSEEEFAALSERRLEGVIALGLALGDAYPDLYQLEIVPPSLQRRRNILQRTSFLVGAAVAALAFLILDYDRSAEARAIYENAARVQSRRVREITSADEAATKALEEYTATWHRSARIVPWLQAGPAVLAALEAVHASLPEDFFIRGVQLFRESIPGRRSRKGPALLGRPVVLVAVEYLQRGGDLSRMRRAFYQDGLLRPGRFSARQCQVLEGRQIPADFKFKGERGATVMVVRIDPFAPERTGEEEGSVE